jgi:hypothetical protein
MQIFVAVELDMSNAQPPPSVGETINLSPILKIGHLSLTSFTSTTTSFIIAKLNFPNNVEYSQKRDEHVVFLFYQGPKEKAIQILKKDVYWPRHMMSTICNNCQK